MDAQYQEQHRPTGEEWNPPQCAPGPTGDSSLPPHLGVESPPQRPVYVLDPDRRLRIAGRQDPAYTLEMIPSPFPWTPEKVAQQDSIERLEATVESFAVALDEVLLGLRSLRSM